MEDEKKQHVARIKEEAEAERERLHKQKEEELEKLAASHSAKIDAHRAEFQREIEEKERTTSFHGG